MEFIEVAGVANVLEEKVKDYPIYSSFISINRLAWSIERIRGAFS